MSPIKREQLSSDEEDEGRQSRGLQSMIPPGQNFAVVVVKRPRLSEITVGETSASRSCAMRHRRSTQETSTQVKSEPTAASRSSVSRVSTVPTTPDDAAGGSVKFPKWDIHTTDLNPDQRRLMFLRHAMQKRIKKVNETGLDSFDDDDINLIKRTLTELSFDLLNDIDYYGSQIGRVVKRLTSVAKFGDDISSMAKKLHERWKRGDYMPAPLGVEEEELESTDDESELGDDGAAGTGQVRAPPYRSEVARTLMKGITRDTGGKRLVYKLTPGHPKRCADVFGNNGLKVGDWWPYQICALRDGAHGSRMGGIYGRLDTGAFSIVVSGDSDYYDNDCGDEIQYAGSHGDPARRDDHAPQLTNATKALTLSIATKKPVRVLRKGPGGKYSPAAGYRYDGLYVVQSRAIVGARVSGERDFYRFHLIRMSNQAPIEKGRPTKAEYSAWLQLTGQS
ncbi:PUA-like domain-containing protein [Geopyxis carbonaria]|nr:PUA-like domain-containing protein [Geopyxis carbonaria]